LPSLTQKKGSSEESCCQGAGIISGERKGEIQERRGWR
jgi:hypothetical protein